MVRPTAKKGAKTASKANEPLAREATINLHKRLHGVSFKNKAPRAMREIKKFAAAVMATADVRLDSDLNKYVWSKGIRNVPFRVRVRLTRKRNEDEEAKDKMYTLVEFVKVPSFKGLTTEKAEIDE
jgi:large subunit ribosomal protein L31e